LLLLALASPAQTLVKDISIRADGSSASSTPAEFVAAGPLAFFAATDRAYGRELHVTDGTLLGTRLVRDLDRARRARRRPR
jgi:ELWxxDGT repeat protein